MAATTNQPEDAMRNRNRYEEIRNAVNADAGAEALSDKLHHLRAKHLQSATCDARYTAPAHRVRKDQQVLKNKTIDPLVLLCFGICAARANDWNLKALGVGISSRQGAKAPRLYIKDHAFDKRLSSFISELCAHCAFARDTPCFCRGSAALGSS